VSRHDHPAGTPRLPPNDVRLKVHTSLRVAYFINQYPKVSHSFIRREILALERQGIEIQRIALRGWDAELVDAADIEEQKRTLYVLRDGIPALVLAVLRVLVTAPRRFFSALVLAVRMGRRADRPFPYHLIYLAEACRLLPWLEEFSASHVHAHFGINSAEIVMLAHALGGPPYSFTAHGTEVSDKPEFLGIGEKVRRSAFTVAVSFYGRGQLYRWVERAQWPKIEVVRCGLERSFYDVPQDNREPGRRLICVGRLSEEKGQLLLLEATHRLSRKGIEFDLVLVGDGEMRAEVEAQIEEFHLSRRVRITGWISSIQVREEMLAARGLVLPSFAEGLPVVIMEAMALRRPVLATYVGGIPELVLSGKNGWLFPAGDVDGLAAAMEKFLSHSAEELRVMGEAAHQSVLQRHSIDTEGAKLAVLFHKSNKPTGSL
jgi:colanic acid/amylovoran biosynthesis glycosyltransferase